MPDADVMNVESMRDAADRACALMRALGNPDRLMLLCQLTQGERCVSDLEAATGIVQPTLSQQLGVLRAAQLVSFRREGKQIFYVIASDDACAVMSVLYNQFCQKEGKHK